MNYIERAKRKHETYSKSTWTTEIEIYDDCVVFYTKDGHGYIRKHKYCDGAISIELVTEISRPVVVEPVVENVEPVVDTVVDAVVKSEPENNAKQKTRKARGKKNDN